MATIFERIIRGEFPSEKVYEDEEILCIKDIHPIAPVHLLIMPKKNFPDLQHMPKEDLYLLGAMVEVAQKMAKKFGVENNYRLLTNIGEDSGQTIFHLHFHLIGGRILGKMA